MTPQQQAARYSSPVLCYGVYAGNNLQQTVAREELQNRRFTCGLTDIELGRQEWAGIQARRAQSDMDAAATAAILLQRPAVPPQVNCTTQTYGNRTYTNCQ